MKNLAALCVKATIRTAEQFLDKLSETLRPLGLTVTTANTLAVLADSQEGLSPHEISERLLITRGAITQIIDLLEKDRLVERHAHPTDRRMLLVSLTDRGRERLRETQPVLTTADTQWLSALSEDEQKTFLNLLEKIGTHLDLED